MVANVRKRSAAKSLASKLRSMSGEAKVNLAIDMSSTAAAMTLDSIRDQYPGISKTKLLDLARKRLQSGRRLR